MKISVLMAVYQRDSAAYLAAALESVYERQTRKPDQIVVVFDGPLTDALNQVLEKFREGKEDIVFYYPQSTRQGLGRALQVGAAYCTGDYIFRMDADDISVPQRFALQTAYLETHPDIDVLGGNVAEFQNDPEHETMSMRLCPATQEEILKCVKRRNPMNHGSVAIRRTALEAAGGYQPLNLLEDYYLWIRMLAAGYRFANMQETLVYMRVRENFGAKRAAKSRVKSWRTIRRFMRTHGMMNQKDALWNYLVYSIGYPHCPEGLRRFVYTKWLRR